MHPLDDVIWNALTTRHAEFAQSFGSARRFTPEVSPLAGFETASAEGYESLAQLLRPEETLALFLSAPYEERAGWNLVAAAPLWQMVCENGGAASSDSGTSKLELEQLGDGDSAAMIELTSLTKPGPFDKRTHELGTYLGIRREGKLMAMAGERLKVPGHTEVSAVCTHPEHTGHGYAGMLMIELMRRIRERGEKAFLHVREDNLRAIQLYEKLGFQQRARVHLAVLRKAAA
jgi:predicted GNAT family acetyltransferase